MIELIKNEGEKHENAESLGRVHTQVNLNKNKTKIKKQITKLKPV